MSDLIRLGYKMKKWLYKIIVRDFGEVSYAKGLYNMICLYEKYVPAKAKAQYRGNKRRLIRKNGFE